MGTMTYHMIIAKANTPTLNGSVYTEDSLKKMADGKTLFWDGKGKTLTLKKEMTKKEQEQILKGNQLILKSI